MTAHGPADPEPGSAANMRLVVEAAASQLLHTARTVARPTRLVLPALTNAHDHGRYFRSATVDAFEKPLESWLPFMGLIPGADPYLSAATLSHVHAHGIAT